MNSSSARAIASRTGLGRMRHVEVTFLWVQRMRGNPADVLTKPLSFGFVQNSLEPFGAWFSDRSLNKGFLARGASGLRHPSLLQDGR